jgi:hypothetical protein
LNILDMTLRLRHERSMGHHRTCGGLCRCAQLFGLMFHASQLQIRLQVDEFDLLLSGASV